MLVANALRWFCHGAAQISQCHQPYGMITLVLLELEVINLCHPVYIQAQPAVYIQAQPAVYIQAQPAVYIQAQPAVYIQAQPVHSHQALFCLYLFFFLYFDIVVS
jgi:hypothetical protein